MEYIKVFVDKCYRIWNLLQRNRSGESDKKINEISLGMR